MDVSNLELSDERGFYSLIADYIVGDPVDEDGLQYRTLTVIAPFVRCISHGARLTIYDHAEDEIVMSFTADSIALPSRSEEFVKIVGRLILAIPKKS